MFILEHIKLFVLILRYCCSYDMYVFFVTV